MKRWFDAWAWPRPRSEALEAVSRVAQNARNPSSLHASGRAAQRELEALREVLFQRVGVPAGGVKMVLTGGPVEAMSIALNGALGSGPAMSAVVRATNRSIARGLAIDGGALPGAVHKTRVPVAVLVDDRDGKLRPRDMGTRIVDGTLALGRIAWSAWAEPTILVLSGPLTGGPPGTGALIYHDDIGLEPLWGGGGQEEGLRSGTQAVALAAGWAGALLAPSRCSWLREIGAELERALDRLGFEILLRADERVPGVVTGRPDDPTCVASALRERSVFPVEVERDGPALRFAVGEHHRDDEVEHLLKTLGSL